jgi:hypothetical protein
MIRENLEGKDTKRFQLPESKYPDKKPEFNFTIKNAFPFTFVIVLIFECINNSAYLKRFPLKEIGALFDANRCLRCSSDSVLRAALQHHCS